MWFGLRNEAPFTTNSPQKQAKRRCTSVTELCCFAFPSHPVGCDMGLFRTLMAVYQTDQTGLIKLVMETPKCQHIRWTVVRSQLSTGLGLLCVLRPSLLGTSDDPPSCMKGKDTPLSVETLWIPEPRLVAVGTRICSPGQNYTQ